MIGNFNSKYKTTLCRHWATTGTCQIGARCHFAHGKEELRNPNDVIQVQNDLISQNPNQQPMAVNPQMLQDPKLLSTYLNGPLGLHNYKTIKCRYFELGICKYKETCHFAHGDQEMRNPQTDTATLNALVLAQQYNQLLEQQQQLQQTGASSEQLQKQAAQMEQVKQFQAQQLQQQQQQAQIQQPQQQTNYSVSQDPTIQKQITVQQLYYIIQQVDQMKPGPEIQSKVKMATELLQAQNIQACSSLLNEVINRQDANQSERKGYEKIISDASQLAVNIMAQYQVQAQVNQQQAQLQQQMPQGQMQQQHQHQQPPNF